MRHVVIGLIPDEASVTNYNLTIPASVWETFLTRMVRRNYAMGAAVAEALEHWSAADPRWEQPAKEEAR